MSTQRKLLIAFVLTTVMMVVEAFGGIWSGSLALLGIGLASLAFVRRRVSC